MDEVKPILVVTGTRREGALAVGPGIIVLAGGGDAEGLAARLDQLAPGCAGIVSFGTGGALERGLAVGRMVIGTRVTGACEAACDPAWVTALRRALPRAKRGAIYADGRLLATRRAKWEAGTVSAALVADMESHIAAAAATRHGVPLAVLRCVSDANDQVLPPAVAVAMAPGGGLAWGAMLGSILRQPWQLPALVATGWRFARSFAALKRGARRVGRRLGFDLR